MSVPTTTRRKAAIEDLFDRYYQRGDVDTITVSTIPLTNTGIQLLISCPSMHGLQRSHEALIKATEAGGGPSSNSLNRNGNNNNDEDENNNNNNQNDGGSNNKNVNGASSSSMVAANNNISNSNNNSPYLADSGETEEDRREKHIVRCGVETILQLAKFKQASLDSQNSSVMIHSQYSNFLLCQFVAGPLLVTLSGRRVEGRSLGLLVALANEIKGEPAFKGFVDAVAGILK